MLDISTAAAPASAGDHPAAEDDQAVVRQVDANTVKEGSRETLVHLESGGEDLGQSVLAAVEVSQCRIHKDIRLGYAQHVYKGQGMTVDKAFVLTGGWQTDRERAYIALSRARERTDIYASHEDLGEQGMNTAAIETLAQAMSESNAKQPSINTPLAERDPGTPGELGPGAGALPPPGAGAGPPGEPNTTSAASLEQQGGQAQEREHKSEVGRIMRESQEQRDREREQDRDLGHGIE